MKWEGEGTQTGAVAWLSPIGSGFEHLVLVGTVGEAYSAFPKQSLAEGRAPPGVGSRAPILPLLPVHLFCFLYTLGDVQTTSWLCSAHCYHVFFDILERPISQKQLFLPSFAFGHGILLLQWTNTRQEREGGGGEPRRSWERKSAGFWECHRIREDHVMEENVRGIKKFYF